MIAWLHAHHLTHPLLALVYSSPLFAAALWWPPLAIAGAFAGPYAYAMREITHVEERLQDGGPGLRSVLAEEQGFRARLAYALRGHRMSNWSADNHWDFWPVVGVNLTIGVGLYTLLAG
jgi:hypothetical protein